MQFRSLTLALILAISGSCPQAFAEDQQTPPSAQAANSTAEKEAFESAKELGTVDAWNAFLTAYPSGFRADLARAYVKKLGSDAPAAAPVTTQAATGTARELSCSELKSVRSLNSDVATKVTFVNKSGAYRSISWINTTGELQQYGGLNSGDEVTYDTFVTHPWMIATGPGDCLQVFMPDTAPTKIELIRLAADDGTEKKAKTKKRIADDEDDDAPARKVKKVVEKKKPLACGQNYKLRNGQCVLVQNCGANAYRSPEGDCYCNKNYEMKNGKCRWKHDKNGFEIAPEKKSGCKGLQQQCNQGNGKACIGYEERCQVN